jgi:hypothetical protein
VIDGLDAARKALADALNVLDEKINAAKTAAEVKKPVATSPTVPLSPAASSSVGVTTGVSSSAPAPAVAVKPTFPAA